MNKRWTIAAAGVAALAGLLGAGYYWLLRRPLARSGGRLSIPGLHGPVEIIRDRWGVPHIYAGDNHDLMLAQGFCHAQDRLWQLDLHRRLVAGRLSEVMGAATLQADRWLRTIGMRRVADQEVALLGPGMRADLEAYAAGINTRLAQGRLPLEFSLLRYRPEPWTVADTLSWIKFMSWTLSVNWEAEILRARLIDRLGPELAAELEPDGAGRWPCIVPPGVDLATVGGEALARAEEARPFTGPPARAGLGSNNWVLSGSRTASGAPLLANDMHLLMSLPAIWYENHLVAGDLDVTGITFPGIPGVVAGHNGHVAWGFTNGFADVQDLYVERLRHDDDGRIHYLFKDEWLDARVVEEEIRVKGAESVVERVVITHHGPIINSLAPEISGEQPLALRWTSLEPDTMIDSLPGMNRARNCLEFRETLRGWTAPIQNVVYADTAGNIGYSFPGKLPIRARGQGLIPAPGWTGEYEWLGYVPFEELPHLYNPPQGYIATANNRTVGDDYPYFISREFAPGDRASRIIELIEARPKIDPAYVRQMHFDLHSPMARTIARHLGRLEVDDPELAAVVELVRDWDGCLLADSPAAAVYQVFYRRLIFLLLSERLGDLAIRYAGKGPTPLLAEGSMFSEHASAWLRLILDDPDSHWFDLGGGERRDDCLRLALGQTVDLLQEKCGPCLDDWAWGKLHTLTYAHILGNARPLYRLFIRGPYPLGGDASTIWATGTSRYDLSCDWVIGPPFRFIADLGDLRNSLGLLAPGQSGQLGSKHYDDQVQAWFDGDYHLMLYAREDVEREAAARLQLLPADKEGL